jgi:hypothetical protein
MMRGREVRERLQTRNVDPELVYVIAAVAEDVSEMRHDLVEMAKQLDMMTNILSNFMKVGDNMKKTIQRLQGGVKSEEAD